MPIIVSLALLVTLIIPSAPVRAGSQDGSDELEIKQLSERLFRALEKEDINAVMACWSSRSLQFNSFKQNMDREFAQSDDTRILNVRFARWKKDKNQISVYIRFDRTRSINERKQFIQSNYVWTAYFIKEEDDWKYQQIGSPNLELASRLSQAGTKEERAQLIKQESDIISVGVINPLQVESQNYARQGNFNEALRLNDIGLEVATLLGDDRELAQCFMQKGWTFSLRYDHAETLKNYQSALSLYQKLKDPVAEKATLSSMGFAYSSAGNFSQAIIQYNLALKISQQLNDLKGEIDSLLYLGSIQALRGNYTEALKGYNAALTISQKLPNGGYLMGTALGAIADVYGMTGKYKEAIEKCEQVRRIAKDINNQYLEILASNGEGLAYKASGRYLEALTRYQAVAKFAEDNNWQEVLAQALNNIGLIYEAIGRHTEAVERFNRSQKNAKAAGNKQIEALALSNKGISYLYLNKFDEAGEAFKTSLEIFRQAGNEEGQAIVLNSLGMLALAKEEETQGIGPLEASLKIARSIGNRSRESMVLATMGALYGSSGQYDKAIDAFKAALKIAESIGDLEKTAAFYQGLGYAYQHQKKWKESALAYLEAITRVEAIRVQVKEPMLQTHFFGQHTSPYFGLIKSLFALEIDSDEIFKMSERAKARTLVEMIDSSKSDLSKNLSIEEKRKEQELDGKIIAIKAQLDKAQSARGSDEEIASLKNQLNDARDAYNRFQLQLFEAHPELQIQRGRFEPANLAQLDQKLFSIEPDTCILSYLADDDEVILLAITKGKGAKSLPNVNHYSLKKDDGEEITLKELNNLLIDFRLRYTNESGIYKLSAQALYKLLISPAENEIKDRSHIIILPDKMLNTLPFQILMDEKGKNLIEKHSISYAPSLTALIEMMRLGNLRRRPNSSISSLFAMGRKVFPDQPQFRNRDLPWAEDQVKSISSLFGVKPYLEAEATKVKAMSGMINARYIHLATHGELNEDAPMYSAIALGKTEGDDGMLYAHDLVKMKLQAELVTLSACDAALGQQINGEGTLGLTWAFFVAGAPSSVVAQWSVRDDSMNELMLEFYRQLRDSEAKGIKISKAEALQRAQLNLMSNPKYKHPYYWAPTVMVGDWR